MVDLARYLIDIPAVDRPGLSLAVEQKMSLLRVQIRHQSDLELLENRLSIDLPLLGGVNISGDIAVICVSPKEWMFIAPFEESDAFSDMISSIFSGTFSLVIDMSHAATILILTGDKARDALNTNCPLDLREGYFPAGSCARSLFGATDIIVARIGPAERYLLVIDQAMTSYIFRLIAKE